MKTTINIDDELLETARELTNIKEKTALVKKALETLIAKESAESLLKLEGSHPQLKNIPRR